MELGTSPPTSNFSLETKTSEKAEFLLFSLLEPK